MYKFDNKARKSAITGIVVHTLFIIIGIVLGITAGLSDGNWAIAYWVAILPAIPTVLSLLLGRKNHSKTTYVFFDRSSFADATFQYILIMFLISIIVCTFVGGPIILYRIGKYIYVIFSKEKNINPTGDK